MAIILKQSTGIDVRVGPFVDATDGVTPETGVALNTADQAEILKANGAATVDISGATWNAVTGCDGWYDLTLTTSHTDTVGEMVIVVQDSSVCLPVFVTCQVVEESIYDSLFAASAAGFDANQRVDVGSWLGTAVTVSSTTAKPQVDVDSIDDDATAADNAELFFDGTGYAGGTTKMGVDVVSVSGDTTAADNLEADYDGTGYNKSASTIGTVTTNSDKTGYRLSATGVDDIWDEATSGHVTAGSFGATLPIIRSNTATAGGATTIDLDGSASATDEFYTDQFIYLLSGTGAGQGRIITAYNGTSKQATVSSWAVNPDATSVFVITPFGSIPGASAPTAAQVADAVWDEQMGDHVSEGSFGTMLQAMHEGTAQNANSNSITLDATGASSTTDFYKYAVVEIIGGAGVGQSRQITAYNGSTKVATVDPAWTTAPTTGEYVIKGLGIDAATTAQIADAVWDEARSGHIAAGTFGEYVLADAVRVSGSTSAADGLEAAVSGSTPLPSNMTQISGDAVAADNLEAYTDGTTPMPVNATQISGDATAADNLELDYDGTGYNKSNSTIGTATAVGSVSGAVGSVTGNVGGNVGGNVVGSVASVTAQVSANVTAISGDATAADNLEAYTDGTTPMPVNATQISGSATAADRLEASALSIVTGACEATPTTTTVQTDLAETTDDHYNGRIVIFTSGVCLGQASDITDYAGASGTLTVTALTDAPSASDTFVIL